MHSTRWITGLIAAALLIALLFAANRALFATVVALAAVAALWEYFGIVRDGEAAFSGIIPKVIASLVTAAAVVGGAYGHEPGLISAIAAGLIAGGGRAVVMFGRDRQAGQKAARMLMGVVYIGLPLGLATIVWQMPQGAAWLLTILSIVFVGDISAFYVGTYRGRRKLCPKVSPNKTVEGALGGLAGSVMVGVGLKLVLFPQVSLTGMMAAGLLMGLTGQIGDLFESVLKRSADIKDSGWLLPGHGGILDRIDALLFALPVGWFFLYFIFHVKAP